MRPFRGAVIVAAAALALEAASTLAFVYPLSPEAISDAYFLATGDAAKREAFFASYTHRFAEPRKGPQILSIQVETPFACVVEQIALHALNTHEPDAQQQFYRKPGEFRVRVVTHFTPTWHPARVTQLGRFWNDFHVVLEQNGSEIPPLSVEGSPIYSSGTVSGYIGATIVSHYDPSRVAPSSAMVIASGPDQVRVASLFDLSRLR